MSTILLLGMESDLANQLARVLRHKGTSTNHRFNGFCAAEARSDVIFAGGDGPDYRETVRRLTTLKPSVPTVLVNRLPKMPAGSTRWISGRRTTAARPSRQGKSSG